jgi:hypothetical protein
MSVPTCSGAFLTDSTACCRKDPSLTFRIRRTSSSLFLLGRNLLLPPIVKALGLYDDEGDAAPKAAFEASLGCCVPTEESRGRKKACPPRAASRSIARRTSSS